MYTDFYFNEIIEEENELSVPAKFGDKKFTIIKNDHFFAPQLSGSSAFVHYGVLKKKDDPKKKEKVSLE